MRVSRAPRLRISSDAPWVISPELPAAESPSEDMEHINMSTKHDNGVTNFLLAGHTTSLSVIGALKKGINTEGQVIMDRNDPWSASKDAFYVIISREGVRRYHSILRLISKLVSVAAFIISTVLFASSTLLQVQPAIISTLR